ncbi:MAG: hypothetical protein DCC51_14680 [Anaerolineae bacterium]|nr:MAG: hypothetical protein DCC51_14680 [Anaerolineae bacterium]
MNEKEKQMKDGGRVEVVERNGIVIETTYDERGEVVGVVKWVKPEKRGDPRQAGPAVGRERRPQ